MVSVAKLKKRVLSRDELLEFKEYAVQELEGELIHPDEFGSRDESEEEWNDIHIKISDSAYPKYYRSICQEIEKVGNSMIRIGMMLNEADQVLTADDFRKLQNEIDLDKSTIAKLRKIARTQLVISNINKLPHRHWSTMHEISKLCDHIDKQNFELLIKGKKLTPKTKRSEVQKLVRLVSKPIGVSNKKTRSKFKVATIYYLTSGQFAKITKKEKAIIEKEQKKILDAVFKLQDKKIRGSIFIESYID